MNTLTKRNFKWRTMEGDILTIDEMSTKHIFNSMKMIFNHVAESFGIPTVWFNNHYTEYELASRKFPKKLASQVRIFIEEIETRNDLPEKYKEAYEQILDIIKSGIFKNSNELIYTKQLNGARED